MKRCHASYVSGPGGQHHPAYLYYSGGHLNDDSNLLWRLGGWFSDWLDRHGSFDLIQHWKPTRGIRGPLISRADSNTPRERLALGL